MAYRIQYLGLGAILDQAIAIVKNHFGLLFTIMLFLLIPFNLLTGFVEMSLLPEMPAEPTMDDFVRYQEAQVKYAPLTSGMRLVEAFFILPLTNAAVIWAVAQLYLGRPVSAAEAFRHAVRRMPALIGTSILMYLAIFGGLILLIIPGILFALWFGLSQHVVVVEGIAGTRALGRSKRLVRNHLGTFLILGFLMGIIFFILLIGSMFIPQPHVQVVVMAMVNALGTMVMTAAGVIFYFSCRCAEENFDLHYLARSIDSESADDEQVMPAAP
jgi:hypothetical protein